MHSFLFCSASLNLSVQIRLAVRVLAAITLMIFEEFGGLRMIVPSGVDVGRLMRRPNMD